MDFNELFSKEVKFFEQLKNTIHTEGGLDKNGLDEIGCLIEKIAKKDMVIGEVGSWTGFSTSMLGAKAQEHDGKAYAIDWFKGSSDSNLTEDRYISPRDILEYNLKNVGVMDFVTVVEKASKDAVSEFEDEFFDFFFIDADHKYGSVKEDIELWYPKVKKGGILCGHDCEFIIKDWNEFKSNLKNIDFLQAHMGVIEAVSERFPEANLTDTSNIWWIIK